MSQTAGWKRQRKQALRNAARRAAKAHGHTVGVASKILKRGASVLQREVRNGHRG